MLTLFVIYQQLKHVFINLDLTTKENLKFGSLSWTVKEMYLKDPNV